MTKQERELTLSEAIREAYVEEMRRDERVFLIGTSIQAPTFPHTKDDRNDKRYDFGCRGTTE